MKFAFPIYFITSFLIAPEGLASSTTGSVRKSTLEGGYEHIEPIEKNQDYARSRPYFTSTIQTPLWPRSTQTVTLKAGFRAWTDLAEKKDIETTEAKTDLDELFVRGSFDSLQIQAGLQKWTWGETFAFQIADIVNPSDLTEFTFSRSQWRKIPVWGVDATLLAENFTLNGIIVPQSRRPRLDYRLFPESAAVDNRTDLAHRAEGGGKLKILIADVVDLSLTAYSHESRLPSLRIANQNPEIYFPRTLTLGASLSAAGESTVLRSDFVWRKKEPVFVSDSPSKPVGVAVGVVGLEMSSREGVTVGLQGHADYFPENTPLPSKKNMRFGVSTRVSLAESIFFLQPELSAYHGISNADFWSGLTLSWNISRNAVLDFEAHLLNGSRDDGMLFLLSNADQLQSRIAFKF
jgi:hypothetical protein